MHLFMVAASIREISYPHYNLNSILCNKTGYCVVDIRNQIFSYVLNK